MRVIMQGLYETDLEAFNNGYDKNWLSDLQDYWCEPTEFHEKRRTFTMLMSRGCTDDNRTHIALSAICESTRYCNYSKGKFGGELTFVDPIWWKDTHRVAYDAIINQYKKDELAYLGAAPVCPEAQMLKRILPLGIKAKLRLCGFDDAWQNFFWRRCDKQHADPECWLISDQIRSMYQPT